MSIVLVRSAKRNSIRRAISSPCWAVNLNNGRILGERLLDLSTDGMLLSSMAPGKVGEKVFITFEAPGSEKAWFRSEAEIARIIYGWRRGDPGYCLGLRLTDFDDYSRYQLGQRLIGFPPPIPQRRSRIDYAETVRRIAYAS